ncbi:unnamed protein product [Prorocentrum cordatum]|uniref:Secreted protein n=1 Tax=Prorocentrum cordatum TaxID=2364126 RepID=A0ABN9R2Z8_9DINO|nr:unnamed protein product [Polarella glacialis]
MTSGSSFTSRVSLSSAMARCLLALLARTDPSAVDDGVGLQLPLPHLAQQRQGPLPLLALLARTDPSTLGEVALGSSFASHSSPSSARALCHCLPSSHALIPAL